MTDNNSFAPKPDKPQVPYTGRKRGRPPGSGKKPALADKSSEIADREYAKRIETVGRKKAMVDMSRWDNFQADDLDTPDRLHVPRDVIPDGIDYQWVTDSVLGQPVPQHRAMFEKKGWMPVPAERHEGMFMPKGWKGEINVEGQVLMERPLEFSLRAKRKDQQAAREQVRAKEAQIRGGAIDGVAFDTQYGGAKTANKVGHSYERVPVPEK